MPPSKDPRKRQRQLANLRRGQPAGDRRSVKHGGYATVATDSINAKTKLVFDALAEDAPLRGSDGELPAADAAMVRLAAEVMCRIDTVSAYLSQHGWLDGKGRPRTTILELEGRLRREAADYLDAMGMTPRARVRLGLDLVSGQGKAFDLAQQWAGADGAQSDVVDGQVVGDE